MTVFVLPAVLALFIKLAVLYASRRSYSAAKQRNLEIEPHRSKTFALFTTMVLVMAGHNLAEIIGFAEFAVGSHQELFLRWYYVMTVFSLAAIVLYAKAVSRVHKKPDSCRLITIAVIALSTLLAGVIMFTDWMIVGSESIGYIMTAIPGAYYWVFKVVSLIGIAIVCFYLVSGYLRARTHISEIQCGFTLLALTPIVITGIVVMVLMTTGYAANAAVVMPLASALFLVITLKGERAHGLFDVRAFIPMSLESKTSAQIMSIFSQYSQDNLNYRDALSEIERLLVTHKHQKHGGNVSSTAASMELPRSSLYSIFRRLEIDLNEEK